jgi:thiamine pyrophosphate-dependent acetolactate synthase large subunit-like protein
MAKVNNTGGKPLQRREVVKALLVDRGDLLVVAGLGAPAWDATEAGDHPLTFPLWGGMGGAVMIGLGLALAQPSRNVLVITGDGEMLMGLGSLATVGVTRPKNLSVVVLDNEVYGETGQQKTQRIRLTVWTWRLRHEAVVLLRPRSSLRRKRPRLCAPPFMLVGAQCSPRSRCHRSKCHLYCHRVTVLI